MPLETFGAAGPQLLQAQMLLPFPNQGLPETLVLTSGLESEPDSPHPPWP